MTKTEKMMYSTKKVIGVYAMGLYGIEVLDIIHGINDFVIYRWNTGTENPADVHRAKINYGVNKTTFRAGRYTVDFSDVMRV